MKRFLLVILLIFTGILFAENFKYFGIKSGKIEFELTGNAVGTKSIWFDDFGQKKRIETKKTTTIKMMGMENVTQEHTLTINDGNHIYSANLLDNTGSKSSFESMADAMGFDKMSKAERQQYFDETLAGMGGQRLQNEKFIGKDCQVISLMGGKSWIYEGITLKNETNVMGIRNVETAIKFDENISVPASKFVPPANIQWYEQNMTMFSDEDYEDEYEDDGVSLGKPDMPFSKFEATISATEIPGYNLMRVMENDDVYQAIFMQTPMNSVMIIAAAYDKKLLTSDSGDLDLSSKFNYNGNDAYYSTTEDGMNLLTVVLKKYKTMINIVKTSQASKDELLKFMDELKF